MDRNEQKAAEMQLLGGAVILGGLWGWKRVLPIVSVPVEPQDFISALRAGLWAKVKSLSSEARSAPKQEETLFTILDLRDWCRLELLVTPEFPPDNAVANEWLSRIVEAAPESSTVETLAEIARRLHLSAMQRTVGNISDDIALSLYDNPERAFQDLAIDLRDAGWSMEAIEKGLRMEREKGRARMRKAGGRTFWALVREEAKAA